jgi:hypothetical protein
MREGPLSADCFLEGGARCSPNVDFAVEKTHYDQLCGQRHNMRLHYFRSVSSGEAPNNITGSVSHMSTNRMRAEINVVYERFFKYGNKTSQTVW